VRGKKVTNGRCWRREEQERKERKEETNRNNRKKERKELKGRKGTEVINGEKRGRQEVRGGEKGGGL
jgi:hypothetical protein